MTTQNFPPPTGTPQRTASGSTTGQTVDATSARDVGRRFLIPSATGLRLSRTLAALACLIAGAVGAWVLTTTSASLESINRGTQQMLRLQQIKGDVLRADGLATNGLAQGTAATAMTDYTDALKEASRLTVEASLAMPTDQNDPVSYTHLDVYKRQGFGVPGVPMPPEAGAPVDPATGSPSTSSGTGNGTGEPAPTQTTGEAPKPAEEKKPEEPAKSLDELLAELDGLVAVSYTHLDVYKRQARRSRSRRRPRRSSWRACRLSLIHI